MKKITFLYLIFLWGFLCQSNQGIAQSDSSLYSKEVILLLKRSDSLQTISPKASLDSAKKALKLIGKHQLASLTGIANYLIGQNHLTLKQVRKSVKSFDKALIWAKEHQDTVLLLNIYHGLSTVYALRKKEDQAEFYKEKFIHLEQQVLSTQQQSWIGNLKKDLNKERSLSSTFQFQANHFRQKADSTQAIVSQQEVELLKQNLALAEISMKAVKAEQEKLMVEIQLRKEERIIQYWSGGTLFLLLIMIGYWFYHRSRKAGKIAREERLEAERLRLLTAGIAHEIKNPLNFVNNFAEGSEDLAEELFEKLVSHKDQIGTDNFEDIEDILEDIKENVTAIFDNGNRVDAIINSIMLQIGKRKGAKELTDLTALTMSTIDLIRNQSLFRHPEMIIDFQEEFTTKIPPMAIIPLDIERVIVNILNNACQSVSSKSDQLGTRYQPQVLIKTYITDNQFIVSVKDNGQGIDPEVLPNIFLPFFTTKHSGNNNYGLGLSICKEIIENDHQGKLEVSSEMGEWCEFQIKLPLEKSLAQQGALLFFF